MRVYIAANYARREILPQAIAELEAHGHTCTARWITSPLHDAKTDHSRRVSALEDVEDVYRADALILFAEQYGDRPGRGKWVEMGLAIAWGKILIVVGGDRGCIFCHLPGLYETSSLEEALQLLEMEESRNEPEDGDGVPV